MVPANLATPTPWRENPNRRPRNRHHRRFTPDFGHSKLKGHLEGVMALMLVSSSWQVFLKSLDIAYPKHNLNLEYPFGEEAQRNDCPKKMEKAMRCKSTVAGGLLLTAISGSVTAHECRDYMVAKVTHDAAVQADNDAALSFLTTGETTSAMRAAYDALRAAEKTRDDAAAAVQSAIDDEIIATAISAISAAYAEAVVAHEAVTAWIREAEVDSRQLISTANDDHAAMAHAIFGAAGNLLSVRVDTTNAYHEAILAACLQLALNEPDQ